MSPDTSFVLLLVLFLGVLVLCTKPLGSYIADIMEGRPNFASRLGGRLEALI
jgi:K+-transporting ATPase ATPase A chain